MAVHPDHACGQRDFVPYDHDPEHAILTHEREAPALAAWMLGTGPMRRPDPTPFPVSPSSLV
jgi:hypothetical protein